MRKILIMSLIFGALLLAQTPTVSTMSPTTAAQGTSVAVTIFGLSFVSTPTADLGTGISFTSLTYMTPSLLVGNISISGAAPLGPHDLIVTNPSGLADTLFNAITITPEDDGPTASIIFPPTCGMYTACTDTMIIIQLEDENGIDDTTVVLRVNGIDYTTMSPELILFSDSILYFIPPTWFSDGTTVNFSLLRVADTFHNVSSGLVPCSFVVDTSSPRFPEPIPPRGASSRDMTPTLLIPISDAGAGEDSSTFELTITMPDGSVHVIGWPHASLRWARDTLIFEASVAGLTFAAEETMNVCIRASDRVQDAGCGPNTNDTCWFIYFHVPPPLALNFTIDQVYTDQFPLISAFCLVNDELGNTVEGLDESNFKVWEDYGSGWQRQHPIVAYLRGGGGMVDVVFCVDVTGSMGGMIGDVRTGLHAFAESLAVAGVSYRLGLNTFGDSVYFPYGYDLTGSVSTFETWVASLIASGGGDWNEVSLDAIYDALDSFHFRPGATIVIIMVTDAPPHYIGDGTWTSYSDVTEEMVLANLLEHRALNFNIVNRGWSGFPETTMFQNVARGSGGEFFPWASAGDFQLVLPLIIDAVRGGYMVNWSTTKPYADCTTRPLRIEVSEDAWGLSDDDQSEYLAPCSPIAAIIEPLPRTWTSNPLQPILMSFHEVEDSIDTNTIQFRVESNIFNIFSPQLSYAIPQMRWTHVDPFTNNQIIHAELVRLMDKQGHLPFSGPIQWYFMVDLLAPRIANRYPAIGQGIGEHQPRICFDLWDEESGLDTAGVLFTVDNSESRTHWPPIITTLDRNSPGVTYSGRRMCWDPSVGGYYFPDLDTVCITIIRADDTPDYGDPNALAESERRWCFHITDDDTLCPTFSNFTPDTTVQLAVGTPFEIRAQIDDQSGVRRAWVEWDIDGSVDDGTFQLDMMHQVSGAIFAADIEGQNENIDFVYRICACDADTDGGDTLDSECCCSEVMPLYFGYGPQAQIIEPLPNTWTTVANQRIVMRIYDDGVVDNSTIQLRVAGVTHNYDADFIMNADTMIYTPSAPNLFTDGQIVPVELVRADDLAGHPLRGTYTWSFNVDLTPPIVENTDPIEGQLTEDKNQDIVFNLNDARRRTDSTAVTITVNDSRSFTFGDPGFAWDASSQTARFIPENASPALTYANDESICVTITCADIPPDYGVPNPMDEYRLCFLFAITTCDIRPLVATPNGDGVNDGFIFEYPRMLFGTGIIHIYDLSGEEIWTSPSGATTWDCKSGTGSIVRPGLYLYSIENDGEVVCNGTLSVIR